LSKDIIYNQEVETRIDQFLKLSIPNISRTKIQKLIRNGNVKVDGYAVKPSFILKNGHHISILDTFTSSSTYNLKPENIKLNIVFEDEDILAINKPAGLVVHPGIKNKDGTLLNAILYYCNSLSNIDDTRPGIIHRLDKETSGLILIAKNDYSHYYISEQFANRLVKKHYKALVWGNMKTKGDIEGYIRRSPRNRLAFELNSAKGKFSKTKFELNYNNDFPISYVNAYPLSGRTHQIRVHFSSINHPIVNDELYNDGVNLKSYHQQYRGDIQRILKKINRVALHSYSLDFTHPSTKKTVKLNAPLTDDFKNAIDIIIEHNEK
tara:strand:- start:1453 stop:2418 length:966 start_codon:yes stop_codon:yes gene_type:complete